MESVPLLLPIASRNLKQKNEALEIIPFIRMGKQMDFFSFKKFVFNLDYVCPKNPTIDFSLSLVLASGKFLEDLGGGIGNKLFFFPFIFILGLCCQRPLTTTVRGHSTTK